MTTTFITVEPGFPGYVECLQCGARSPSGEVPGRVTRAMEAGWGEVSEVDEDGCICFGYFCPLCKVNHDHLEGAWPCQVWRKVSRKQYCRKPTTKNEGTNDHQ